MNISFARIRCSLAEAMERFTAHVNPNELEPPMPVELSDVVDLSLDENGQWRGGAKFVYENQGWTVFEDHSGHLGEMGAQVWLNFASGDDFVFAGYNDSIPYGELIVIRRGRVLREFLDDVQNPDDNVDTGALAEVDPLKSWVSVASLVDDDDIVFSETGLLWLHGPLG